MRSLLVFISLDVTFGLRQLFIILLFQWIVFWNGIFVFSFEYFSLLFKKQKKTCFSNCKNTILGQSIPYYNFVSCVWEYFNEFCNLFIIICIFTLLLLLVISSFVIDNSFSLKLIFNPSKFPATGFQLN